MQIKFKKLQEDAVIPIRADNGSAGYDLVVPASAPTYLIPPFGRELIKLGFSTEIVEPEKPDRYSLSNDGVMHINQEEQNLMPDGFQIEIRPRSGNAIKKGLTVLNTPGTIDSSYRGEWGVIVLNASTLPLQINPGDKIAQAVLMPYWRMDFTEVESLEETERGEGGFGSSDKKVV